MHSNDAHAPNAASAPDSQPQPLPRPLRIVHVDDEIALIQLFQFVLCKRLKHLELVQFLNSVTAFEFLKHFNPDLLITDDRMPRVAGNDIVTMLAERQAPVPIIVVSSWERTAEWVERFASQGLRISLLIAPFEMSALFDHLSRHLGPLDSPS